MHEKRLKAHKKRYAAYLKKCKKSKKCWAVHIGRMRAHERRMKHRKGHEKRMKHHKKRSAKRRAMHEKRMKHFHKKRRAAYEKRAKHYHKKRYAAYLKKCKKSKKCWAAHKKRLAARRKHI